MNLTDRHHNLVRFLAVALCFPALLMAACGQGPEATSVTDKPTASADIQSPSPSAVAVAPTPYYGGASQYPLQSSQGDLSGPQTYGQAQLGYGSQLQYGVPQQQNYGAQGMTGQQYAGQSYGGAGVYPRSAAPPSAPPPESVTVDGALVRQKQRAAATHYRPGEVIVKFRDGESATTLASDGAQVMKRFSAGRHRLHHVKLRNGLSVEEAITKYGKNPAVEYVEPNYTYQLSDIPNDPQFGQLWGLHNTGQTVRGVTGTPGADIQAAEAWDITTGSSNVIIAVIDTGIAYDHPDLAANMWTNPGETPNDGKDNDGNGFIDDVHGYDFFNDDGEPMDVPLVAGISFGKVGHGTSIAGTIAAAGNNGMGVTGVMRSARLMALKAGDGWEAVGVTTAAFIQATNYAITNGARVINASFGRVGGSCSQFEYDALSAANTAGIMVLVAAGNQTQSNDAIPQYPAQYSVDTACGPALPNVIAVAATDMNDNLSSFSNYGPASVQIASPGSDQTYSTYPTFNAITIPPFPHNFDSNPATLGYTFSGTNNSWNFTASASASPPNSLTDSPAGNYVNNTNSFATGPVYSTVGQRGCYWTGNMRLTTASNADYVLFQVSSDGGTTWIDGKTYSGDTGGSWFSFLFREVRDASPTNRFRINLFSDGSGNADGAYLDDVRVSCVAGAPSGATDYAFLGGTSSATAHVTGVVGLLLSANPSLTVPQIRNAIVNTGDVLPGLSGKTLTGRRLNARKALETAGDPTPPTAPATLTASPVVTGTQIALSWPAATDNVGVTGYQVERCQGAGCSAFAFLATSPTTSYGDSGLAPTTSYSYRVRAQDAAGNFGPYSPTATATTTAAAPGDNFNRANGTDLGPSWDPGYTDQFGANTNLQIVGNRVRTTTTTGDATETFTGVIPGSNQFAQFTLATATGTSVMAPRVLLRFSGPGAKSGYEFSIGRGVGFTSRISRWNGGVFTPLVQENATPWAANDILRAEAEGTTLRLYRNNVLVLSTTDATFASGRAGITIYAATIADVELDDFSAGNLTASTDTTPPTAPSTLTGSANGTQIALSWPAATDNVGVTGYQVERCQGAGCSAFAFLATSPTTSYGDSGLAPTTSYSYRVRAQDAAGNFGPYSPTATATTTAAAPGDNFNRANGDRLGPQLGSRLHRSVRSQYQFADCRQPGAHDDDDRRRHRNVYGGHPGEQPICPVYARHRHGHIGDGAARAAPL